MELVVALYQFAILLFSISVHQCAQAWMSSRLGDHTARLEGRISLNPTQHIDPFGTLLYPGLMIFGPLIGFTWFGNGSVIMGWGKPTPIITRNLKKITRDDNLITLAGPTGNLILVVVGMVLIVVLALALPAILPATAPGATPSPEDNFSLLQSVPGALYLLGKLLIRVNLGLIFFNMLPVPPLDASRILRNLLPYNALQSYDSIARYGAILIFFLGSFLVQIFLPPALTIVYTILALILRGH
jgi:Zn-dependent protease